MNCRAILTIEEREYELLRFMYSFARDTSSKGYPTSPILGGTFYFQVESTAENELLKILLRKELGHYINGNIRVLQTSEGKLCVIFRLMHRWFLWASTLQFTSGHR